MHSASISRLEDESAVRRLVAEYCDAVSLRDAARASGVYIDDGVAIIAGNELKGREAIRDGMRQTFAAFSLIQMIAHAGLVEIDGDTARARHTTLELTVKDGSSSLSMIFGRYEDEVVRTPAGWRFARRTFTMAGRTMVAASKLQLNPGFADALQFAF